MKSSRSSNKNPKERKSAANSANVDQTTKSKPVCATTRKHNEYEGQTLDTMLHAWLARMTLWTSPASFSLAVFDWLAHIAIAPAKQTDLAKQAVKDLIDFYIFAAAASGLVPCAVAPNDERKHRDTRFKDSSWEQFPFNVYAQAFKICDHWWQEATTSIRGVTKHHEDVVSFAVRQTLDVFSPSNYPWMNPEVIYATYNQAGMNFVNGMKNFIEDAYREYQHMPPVGSENFTVGVDVAVTPGKIVYRNQLIELIQYSPTTEDVYAEPVLVVPAWIMKYYILDLSPHNSLVKYLVSKGHTVFIISWKNPGSEERSLGLEDYLNLGVLSALETINKIVPDKKVHAAGYCLGGTLLMIAAAYMAGINDERLKTITLFAAQVDFREPGDLSLLIDHSQVTFLEDIMWEKGYLDGAQMSSAFSMLHSNDLIWSRMIHDYLLGKRRPLNDLMAWNNDTTRMPYQMHSEYLRNLFLHNELVQARFYVNRKRIALMDIQTPMFVVSTVKDHVSPWRSVYKINLATQTDLTFVLTNGGHNAGIVSEPGHKNRNYQMMERKQGAKYITADTWLERAPKYEGSWWPAWEEWLAKESSGKTQAPEMGCTKQSEKLQDAPGCYVMEK